MLADDAASLEANIAATSQLTPPEGHSTELSWQLQDLEGAILTRGTQPWLPEQYLGVTFAVTVPKGRHYLQVEICIDGVVHKILRKLLVASAPGQTPVSVDDDDALPSAVEDLLRRAFGRPLARVNGAGFDGAQLDEIEFALTSIAMTHRSRVIAFLSSPNAGDETSALFHKNIPATVRPDLLRLLSGRLQRLDRGAAGPAASQFLALSELVAKPKSLVIAPWMEGTANTQLRPHNPMASEAMAGRTDPNAERIDVAWPVQDPEGEVAEHQTHWQRGKTNGEPLDLDVTIAGNHKVQATFSYQGIALEQRSS